MNKRKELLSGITIWNCYVWFYSIEDLLFSNLDGEGELFVEEVHR